MHAVIGTVTIAAGQTDAARKSLNDDVVPRVKSAPGFVKGYWAASADGAHGTSMLLFKTKQDADNAANMARTSPRPPGVTLDSVDVREVIAEA
jgi:hypothetical protein